jgi:hypothetical protein
MADTLTRLPEIERRAIQAELVVWLDEMKQEKAAGRRASAGQNDIGGILGFTQGAIHKAIRAADCGPGFRDAVLRARATTMPELLAKHGLGSGQMQAVRPPPPGALDRIDERYRSVAISAVAVLVKRGWPEDASWDALANVRLHGPTDSVGPLAMANAAQTVLYGEVGTELGRPLGEGSPSRPRRKSTPPAAGKKR